MELSLREREIVEITERFGANHYDRLPLVVSFADGVWLYDLQDKRIVNEAGWLPSGDCS